MSKAGQYNRLAWLAAAWSEQRHKIASLLGRIKGLGTPGGMKPKTFTKFLHLMDQVAAEKDHETKLISEIDEIERKHRLNRNLGFVKRVGADNDGISRIEHPYEEGRRKYGWLWWAVIWWCLMTSQQSRINSKKQSLTAD